MYQSKFKKRLWAVLMALNSALKGMRLGFWLILIGIGAILGGLGGCHTTLPTKVLPPVELLQDCPESSIAIRTNGDLAKAVPILRQDLRVCNLDKQALRRWAEE